MPRKIPSSVVQSIYRDERPHGEVARDHNLPVSTVSRIRGGNIQQAAYQRYVAEHGKPIWRKARRGGPTREDIIWLYETEGTISDREAGYRLSMMQDSVRRIRCGDYYSTTHKRWHDEQRAKQRASMRERVLCGAWGPIAETLNGVKGRFAQ